MIRFGFNVPLIGLDRPPKPSVELLTWAYSSSAGISTIDLTMTGTVTAACEVYWRITYDPPRGAVIAMQTVWPDANPPHDQDFTGDLATYGGKTYTLVECRILQNSVEVQGWTTIPGATVVIPTFGGAPVDGGGTVP